MLAALSPIQNANYSRDLVAELIADKRSQNTKRAYKREGAYVEPKICETDWRDSNESIF